MRVWLNLPHALPSALLNDRDLYRAAAVTRGWGGTDTELLKRQHRKLTSGGNEDSPVTPAGVRIRDLPITTESRPAL